MTHGKLLGITPRAENCKHCGDRVETHTYEARAWGDDKPRHTVDKCVDPSCKSHMIWGGP